MHTTISTALVAATLLLNIATAYTQTLGPSALRNALNATDGAEIDALYAPRPPMVRMWNWGGALNGVNADLRMNGWHVDYPFSGHAVTDTMPQRSIRRISSMVITSGMMPAAIYHTLKHGFVHCKGANRVPNRH